MLTFLLKEEPFNPDSAQCGDDGCCDDLQRLQVCTVRVDLMSALLQVQEDHLLIHLPGTLNTQAHIFLIGLELTEEFQVLWVLTPLADI